MADVKRLKRDYVSAVKARHEHSSMLQELQKAAAHMPAGLLEPAIDFMFDKVEESERAWREALTACLAKGIRKAYGYNLVEWLLPKDEEPSVEYGEIPGMENS